MNWEKMKMKKMVFLVVLMMVLISGQSFATDYYVDQNHPAANDSNTGTIDHPWLTISHAENIAIQPGDIVYVRSGTYDERVSCSHSGSAAKGYINFVGYPEDPKPVMRGFNIYDQSYIRIIGFEITHNSLDYTNGITLFGSSSFVEILDNYFHHTYGSAIRQKYHHSISNIIVRGNHMYYLNCPSGVEGECKGGGGLVAVSGYGDHFLIEYNKGHRAGDYINVTAPYNIVRNNYLYDYRNSYFPDGSGDGNHVDVFQPIGSDTLANSRYHVYEANLMGDNIERNSHILQMRTRDSSEHHIIFRGNIGYNHGSYAMQCGGVDNVYFYNNTLYRMNYPGGTGVAAYYNEESGEYALDNYNINNIYFDTGGSPIAVQSGNSCVSSNNLGYLTGSHASLVSTEDPLFVNRTVHDFHLQSNSPAKGQGKAITTVISSNGSSTSFIVADAGFFCDGYGIAEGDIIKVGTNDPARITDITANTITVKRSIIWNNGDGVYWRNQDTSPDIGAYEYRSGNGYQYDITIDNPPEEGMTPDLITFTATPTNPDCIRFVMFYIDGLPVVKMITPPYLYTWSIADSAENSRHIIEARAYALYADKILWQSDKGALTISQDGFTWEPIDQPSGQPGTPGGLKILGMEK